jgi:hypothetical protein
LVLSDFKAFRVLLENKDRKAKRVIRAIPVKMEETASTEVLDPKVYRVSAEKLDLRDHKDRRVHKVIRETKAIQVRMPISAHSKRDLKN